jgi:ElaB/YqjD/DUF883 family membrane-anchored ribosome-binding protein
MSIDTMQTSGSNGGASNQRPERLQEAASGVMDQAGRTVESQASQTMSRAGDALQQLAQAVRDTGQQLRQERPEIAGIADTAAQRVEQASSYLREHDAREVFAEAERIARRQPVAIVGGGLILGMLVGRLLRSGAEPMNAGSNGRQGATGRTGWYGSDAAWSGSGAGMATGSAGLSGDAYGTGYGGTYDATGGTGRSGLSAAARDTGSSGYDTGATNPYDPTATSAFDASTNEWDATAANLAATDAAVASDQGSTTSSGTTRKRRTKTGGSQ